MGNGTVVWFSREKNYGFIRPDKGGKDMFVHISAVESAGLTTLATDEKVSYDTEIRDNGRMAAVRLIIVRA